MKSVAVSASAYETKAAGGFADFLPEKTVDGDLSANSSWRAEIKDEKIGQWIQYDLGAVKRLAGVRLAFVKGEERIYRFDIELSADDRKWSTAFSGKSSGKDKGLESFSFPSSSARYLRIRGFGNSSAKFARWINIVETEIIEDAQEEKPVSGSIGPRLLFRSGFEAESQIINQTANYAELVGLDRSVEPPNNWSRHLSSNVLGGFKLQYQGGESTQRLASIEPDPSNPANRTLRYWIRHVNVEPEASWGGKARIQANIYDIKPGLRDIYYRFRVFFPQDWQKLVESPQPMGWCILAEFWNNANWIPTDYPFRVHINMSKSERGLHFGAHSDGQRAPRAKAGQGNKARGASFTGWEIKNTEFTVPLGEWLTGEVYFREGKADTGRFFFAVTRADGTRAVLCDVRNFTCHPDDPAPDGLRHFNPLKLYSQRNNVDTIRQAGGVMQVYWDDFELWTGRLPD